MDLAWIVSFIVALIAYAAIVRALIGLACRG